MSAVQRPGSESHAVPMTALHFAPMRADDISDVLAIEQDVYPFPWTHGNFMDSLYSGYETWTLRDAAGALAGYFLLMIAVDEAHLLNITVRRDLHGRGVGRLLLGKVRALASERRLSSILLEVRPSNHQALAVYEHYGFTRIGLRRGYYPAPVNKREDAIVMRLSL